MADAVAEAAITGAALVRHLDDVRFASLRGLRQLLRALGAERLAIGFVTHEGEYLKEELVWASGFGRCGESRRVVSCASFAREIRDWLASDACSLGIDIDVHSPAWHSVPCEHFLLVRGALVIEGLGRLVLAAQLRREMPLTEGADRAIAIYLNEYGKRRLAPAA